MIPRHILLSIGLLLTPFAIATAQTLELPLQENVAVATCLSGSVNQNSVMTIDPDGYVMGVVDVRTGTNLDLGTNWMPPMYHHPSWTARNLGQIFGLTLDEAGNIYVGATTMYGLPNNRAQPGVFGPGGSGGVYRIDGVTGAISVLARLPNDETGLGDLVYSRSLDRLFVTNMEDGKIYSLSPTGTIDATFDPFTADDGDDGMPEHGERLWGIAYRNRRVYYGVWRENWRDMPNPRRNEVWSVEIGADNAFLPATNRRELVVPIYPGQRTDGRSDAVADIAFGPDGRMLLGLTTFFYDYGTTEYFGRVLEYVETNGVWSAPTPIYVGNLRNRTNAQGGVDYGGPIPSSREASGCVASIWATGNPLIVDDVANAGIAGIPLHGNTTASVDNTSLYIDADGVIDRNGYVKGLMGDIEIMKGCCANAIEGEELTTPRLSIGSYGPYAFEDTVSIAVRIDSTSDDLPVTGLTCTIGYLPLTMRPLGLSAQRLTDSLRGTPLDGWRVASAEDDTYGMITIVLEAPQPAYLNDTGVILSITFQTFLVIDMRVLPDSIQRIPIPLSVETTSIGCVPIIAESGLLTLEICGLDQRLIEWSAAKFRLDPPTLSDDGTVSVTYSVGLDAPTRLELFAIDGRRVATLVDGIAEEPGEHHASWNSGELGDGIYLLRLQSGTWTGTRRVIVRR